MKELNDRCRIHYHKFSHLITIEAIMRYNHWGIIQQLDIIILPRFHDCDINLLISLLEPSSRKEPMILLNGHSYTPRSSLSIVGSQVSSLKTFIV